MNLKEIRVKHGYSQEGLAQITGVGLRTIQRIENGSSAPRIQTVQKIAEGLGMDIESINFSIDKHEYKTVKRITVISCLLFANPFLGILVTLIILISSQQLSKKSKHFLKKIVLSETVVTLLFVIIGVFVLRRVDYMGNWSFLKTNLALYICVFMLGVTANLIHFNQFKNNWTR